VHGDDAFDAAGGHRTPPMSVGRRLNAFWRDKQAGDVDEPDAAVCIGSHQVVGELGVVDTAAYALGDRIDLVAIEPGIVSGDPRL